MTTTMPASAGAPDLGRYGQHLGGWDEDGTRYDVFEARCQDPGCHDALCPGCPDCPVLVGTSVPRCASRDAAEEALRAKVEQEAIQATRSREIRRRSRRDRRPA